MADDSEYYREDMSLDASRRKLIEKAVYSMPTKSLKELVPNGASNADFSHSVARKSANDDIVSGGLRLPEPGRIVSARLSFPELIVQKSKERPFLKELTDQLQVALSGSAGEPLAATMLHRASDEEHAVVQLSLPLLRGEQLKSLLSTPNLLTYTPLLRFGHFDSDFFRNVVGPTTQGIREQISFPAPEIVSRLDEMEKRYLEIRDRRNLIESFHNVMKLTNPYDARAAALQAEEESAAGGPILPGSIPGLDGPGERKPEAAFPWSAPAVPTRETGYSRIIDAPGERVVRGMPPSATVVLAKNAIETAVSQLSVDGVQLSAASAEITRRMEEAEETAELGRIAAAGLASPAVLEALVTQSTLRREQQRQTDEQRVLAAWEKDQLASGMRGNNLAYMQRLFAIATGDDDTVKELESERLIMDPETVRTKIRDFGMRKFEKKNLEKVPITISVGKCTNILQGIEVFIRIKILANEAQTATCTSGSVTTWNEEIFLEIPKVSLNNAEIEILLFQYNAMAFDVLLAQARIALRDTNDQIGTWMLTPQNGTVPSVSMRIDVGGDSEYPAYQRLNGVGIKSVFPHDLQSSQNLLRERNMDFVFDQVERIDEERRRIENKIGKINLAKDVGSIVQKAAPDIGYFEGDDEIPEEITRSGLVPSVGFGARTPSETPDVFSNKALPPNGASASALRQVSKPFPTYEALYKELVSIVQRGRLGEARQLCFDLTYVGQSKLDFGRDPRLMEYLSLMSDVLVEFSTDVPIVLAGLVTLCVMFSAVSVAMKKPVGLVLFEACMRSMHSDDTLLADQVLTSLALVIDLTRNSSTNTMSIIDFALLMFSKSREPVQMEQVMQILGVLKSDHRSGEQVDAILSVLERCRFNERTVQRALVALANVLPQQRDDQDKGPLVQVKKRDGQRIVELVVVAAGMYVDSGSVQVAALDALGVIANIGHAERVENILAPIVIDQCLDRNMNNSEVILSVAQLFLRVADMRSNKFSEPEAISALMRIFPVAELGCRLVTLAAIRSCFNNSKKDGLPRSFSEPLVVAFVSALEQGVRADASLAKEGCLTVEALIQSVELREPLIRSGIVSVPLASIRTWNKEYPRMVKTFLSSLHATVLSSQRGAFQFAKLDGVSIVFELAVASTEWRPWAILADACCVQEAKASFAPDEDIARVVEYLGRIGREGNGDIEVVLQSIRLVGEIAFNSSMSTKELFEKLNTIVRAWFTNLSFPLSTVVWGLIGRKVPPKDFNRFDRMTVPNGKDLNFQIGEVNIREYNVWVTAQGGASVGASVAKTKKDTPPTPKGFIDSLW